MVISNSITKFYQLIDNEYAVLLKRRRTYYMTTYNQIKDLPDVQHLLPQFRELMEKNDSIELLKLIYHIQHSDKKLKA